MVSGLHGAFRIQDRIDIVFNKAMKALQFNQGKIFQTALLVYGLTHGKGYSLVGIPKG